MTHALTNSGIWGDRLDECVACKTRDIRFWQKKRFKYTQAACHEEFHIYRCECCGTGFLNRPPNPKWLESIYRFSGQALTHPIRLEDVLAKEARYPNCIVDAERISNRADALNSSGNRKALDIGSGFGFYTRALRTKEYQTTSINPGKYENEVFEELNGDAPLSLKFEAFETSERFGLVLMSQVLEHLLEPDKAISKVSSLLAPGGVLACAVPNYDSFLVRLLGTRDNACLWVPEHVNYFTVKGLKMLMERNGLRVLQVEQVTRIPYDALSRRLGLTGRPALWAERFVKRVQIPFVRFVNRLDRGIYIHLYAVKAEATPAQQG